MKLSVKVNQKKYYEMETEGQKRYINRINNAILKSQIPLLLEMKKIADSIIKRYHSDFYIHDIEMLLNNPSESFFWFVREHGTNLIHFNVKDIEDHFKAVTTCTRFKKIYFYDSKLNQLKTIKLEKANEILLNLIEYQELHKLAI